jgi:hypothetical protein
MHLLRPLVASWRRFAPAVVQRTGVATITLAAAAGPAYAQADSSFTWRARVTDEAAATQPNGASPFLSPDRTDAWQGGNDLVASGDGTWSWRDRVKFGGGLLLIAPSDDTPELRVREGYARASVSSWMDVEAGKRLVRWGTGYAFTPTGLLDPPRDATDPQDRLGLNEGMVMARVDIFRGASAITMAAAAPRLGRPDSIVTTTPRRLLALRARTTLAGVEMALVASAADTRRVSFGGNFTHVIGQQFEYHGELLVHDDDSIWRQRLAPNEPTRPRRVSAVLGFQYTFDRAGMNTVVEYYRDGNGLSSVLWDRLMGAASAPTAASAAAAAATSGGGTLTRPTRRDFLFLRGARANTDGIIQPELLTLIGLDDGGVTLVPSFRIVPTRHFQYYVRGLILTGPARSADGSAPTASTISAGLTVVF